MGAEILMEIKVQILEPISVEGQQQNIVMIPFTAEASGPYN